ncbi:hypothetical protein [Streptomyces sp. NPDC047525]|uniref:hypothetical protein n=1 Tax=Streptomyces sp. NPDC047525 TaxID=3155264 RepID=UPI0033E6DD44
MTNHRGRPSILPSDKELLKLEAAGLTHQQIGDEYGVSRQAVTKRFNTMGLFVQAIRRDVSVVLPWDLSQVPNRSKLKDSVTYIGLRAYVRDQLGAEVSPRAERALKTFVNHVQAGEILELDSTEGLRWATYAPEQDGDLILRWPESAKKDKRVNLFRRSELCTEAAEPAPESNATE